MITPDKLYHLFKPLGDENKITKYPLIIGGVVNNALDMVKGGYLLTLLNSQVVTKGDYKPFYKENGELISDLSSIIKHSYQLDFYLYCDDKDKSLEVMQEIEKMRSYLNSYDCTEYLNALKASILPVIGDIQFLQEYTEQRLLISRAVLEFSILTTSIYKQDFHEIDKVKIKQNLI